MIKQIHENVSYKSAGADNTIRPSPMAVIGHDLVTDKSSRQRCLRGVIVIIGETGRIVAIIKIGSELWSEERDNHLVSLMVMEGKRVANYYEGRT